MPRATCCYRLRVAPARGEVCATSSRIKRLSEVWTIATAALNRARSPRVHSWIESASNRSSRCVQLRMSFEVGVLRSEASRKTHVGQREMRRDRRIELTDLRRASSNYHSRWLAPARGWKRRSLRNDEPRQGFRNRKTPDSRPIENETYRLALRWQLASVAESL